mmetsp:Transcript_2489/g.5715  ORF Transcript_2489/g.5715 Transcript_2489/m.5715 type:complete len:218 (+) Transcript_2489:2507-3160(+)
MYRSFSLCIITLIELTQSIRTLGLRLFSNSASAPLHTTSCSVLLFQTPHGPKSPRAQVILNSTCVGFRLASMYRIAETHPFRLSCVTMVTLKVSAILGLCTISAVLHRLWRALMKVKLPKMRKRYLENLLPIILRMHLIMEQSHFLASRCTATMMMTMRLMPTLVNMVSVTLRRILMAAAVFLEVIKKPGKQQRPLGAVLPLVKCMIALTILMMGVK